MERQDLHHRRYVSVQQATTRRTEAAIMEADAEGNTWTHFFAVPASGVDVPAAERALQHLYRPVRQGRSLNAPVTQDDKAILQDMGIEAETGWQEWVLW